MDKYRKKLPKEELKRFAKEIGKILTASDFKHKRVDDPTKITEYHEKKVKKSVRDYFDKAVAKKMAYDKKKAEKKAAEALKNGHTPGDVASNGIDIPATVDTTSTPLDADNEDKADVSDAEMSDDDLHAPSVPATPAGDSSGDDTLKRKREDEIQLVPTDPDDAFAKRFKADGTAIDATAFDPPPPPPPPPADTQMSGDDSAYGMEEDEDPAIAEMRAAQEALERENEEAARDEEMQQAMVSTGESAQLEMPGDKLLAPRDFFVGNDMHVDLGGEPLAEDTPTVINGDGNVGDNNGSGEMEGLIQSERKEVLTH